MSNTQTLLLVLPLVILQLVLMIINLVNVIKKDKTKYLNKTVWILIIILGNLIGNIICLVLEGGHGNSDKIK